MADTAFDQLSDPLQKAAVAWMVNLELMTALKDDGPGSEAIKNDPTAFVRNERDTHAQSFETVKAITAMYTDPASKKLMEESTKGNSAFAEENLAAANEELKIHRDAAASHGAFLRSLGFLQGDPASAPSSTAQSPGGATPNVPSPNASSPTLSSVNAPSSNAPSSIIPMSAPALSPSAPSPTTPPVSVATPNASSNSMTPTSPPTNTLTPSAPALPELPVLKEKFPHAPADHATPKAPALCENLKPAVDGICRQ